MRSTIFLLAGLLALLPAAASAAPSAKAMANTCFICHGPGGHESLTGMSQRELIEEMTEMKREPGEGRLMSVIAKGFSDAEIKAMGAYIATLKK
jgi:cytochrome subunit of sulfide dehydrogenase